METKDIYTRNWSLTIWENAECYKEIFKIIENLKNCNYYIIQHTPEKNEQGNHYHLELEYESAKSFTSIQKKFKGAHIEKTINRNKAIQYLIHLNDSNKKQYNYKEIKTNNIQKCEYYITANLEYDILTEEIIFTEIETQNLKTITDFYKRYGQQQTYKYRLMILDLLKEIDVRKINSILEERINDLEKQLNEK